MARMAAAVMKDGKWWIDAGDRDAWEPLDVPADAYLGDAARAVEALGYDEVSIRIGG